jgi:hypothetical protein
VPLVPEVVLPLAPELAPEVVSLPAPPLELAPPLAPLEDSPVVPAVSRIGESCCAG